jgi:hypothetical protein
MYYLRSDLCVCLFVCPYFFFFFLVGTSGRTDLLDCMRLNWNWTNNWKLPSPWHSYILTGKITETLSVHPWHSCFLHYGLPDYLPTKKIKNKKKWLTDFIPYGRTDFRTLHCIALHCIACIALYCITCIACVRYASLRAYILNCVNVNSTACLLLNCIGHVKCITSDRICVFVLFVFVSLFSFFWFGTSVRTDRLTDCMRLTETEQTAETCLSINRHYFTLKITETFCHPRRVPYTWRTSVQTKKNKK